MLALLPAASRVSRWLARSIPTCARQGAAPPSPQPSPASGRGGTSRHLRLHGGRDEAQRRGQRGCVSGCAATLGGRAWMRGLAYRATDGCSTSRTPRAKSPLDGLGVAGVVGRDGIEPPTTWVESAREVADSKLVGLDAIEPSTTWVESACEVLTRSWWAVMGSNHRPHGLSPLDGLGVAGVVGRDGIEPSTNGLKVHCSTAELTAHRALSAARASRMREAGAQCRQRFPREQARAGQT